MADNKEVKQNVKALVFDAYGTLFDVHSVISLCNELFPEQGQAMSEIWRAKQLEYTWLLSLMGRYEDFWQVTQKGLRFACQALDLTCEAAHYDQLMKAYLRLDPYPEVKEALTALSGYPLSILSNGSPLMLDSAVTSANLAEMFERVISVDKIRIFKPSPRVYQMAVDELGLAAKSIGFVSSNAWDIIGAASFGLQTFWVNRAGKPMDELGFKPAMTIGNLTELADVLRSS